MAVYLEESRKFKHIDYVSSEIKSIIFSASLINCSALDICSADSSGEMFFLHTVIANMTNFHSTDKVTVKFRWHDTGFGKMLPKCSVNT